MWRHSWPCVSKRFHITKQFLVRHWNLDATRVSLFLHFSSFLFTRKVIWRVFLVRSKVCCNLTRFHSPNSSFTLVMSSQQGTPLFFFSSLYRGISSFFIWIILMKTDGSNREKLQKLDILRLNHEPDGQLAHFGLDVLTSDEQYYSNQTNKKYVMIWRVFSVLVKNPSFSKVWFLRLRGSRAAKVCWKLSLLSFGRLGRSVI